MLEAASVEFIDENGGGRGVATVTGADGPAGSPAESEPYQFRLRRSRSLSRLTAANDVGSPRARLKLRVSNSLTRMVAGPSETTCRSIVCGVLLEPMEPNLEDIKAIFAEIDRLGGN